VHEIDASLDCLDIAKQRLMVEMVAQIIGKASRMTGTVAAAIADEDA